MLNLIFFALGKIPGLLFLITLFVCLISIIVCSFVGYNLKECKNNIKTARGYLRSGLEYVQRNKNKDDSIPNLKNLIKNTRLATFRLYNNQFWFDIWLGIYSQFWTVAPKIFFGFNVFSGYVKYGHVTKTENVLGNVVGSMSTPIWLWESWTEYLAVAQRLHDLEETINNPENWKEPKKEEGWEDRREKKRIKSYYLDAYGNKIELTEEEVKVLRTSIKERPHIFE